MFPVRSSVVLLALQAYTATSGITVGCTGKNEVRLGSFLLSRYGKQMCSHFEYVNIWGGMKQLPFK